MSSSIRKTLIGWYGVLLAAVLATFGALLYGQAATAALGDVDAALEDRARAIAGALEWDEQDGWELELSDDYLRGLAADTYFRVWTPEGALLRQGGGSGAAGADPSPGLHTAGNARELARKGPGGTSVLVGRSIAAERARLNSLLALVIGVGLLVVGLGVAGGSWLARRTLAPVSALADAAAAVTERDLSARLDERHAPEELRGLARAFNATLDRLEAAFARQARFTADASHELRTPVAILRAQVETALKGERAASEYRSTLEACGRAADRMAGLTESLLALARADAGERPAAGPVALDALVREGADLLRPSARAAGVELRCSVEPATVVGDARLLSEVLSNLVTNGFRYNRPGGRVDVTLGRENGEAVLRVRDTGVGIPTDALPHVFERFYRVDAARSRAHGGSGLGLSIVRWIVEAHKGTVEVLSEPDVGSTFTVRLPVAR
jgi:heavy metal sensor kinase